MNTATEKDLRKGNFKSFFDLLQDLLILLATDKRDWQTLGTETTGTTHTVQVWIGIPWEIVVNGKVDTLNIDTTTEHVRGDADTLVELLELFVTFDTIGY